MSSTTSSATAAATTAVRASHQGGVFDHVNPSQYDTKNPITTFIIQAGIIVIFCRLLHWPLSRLRQPRVIAEVIGGILLGPSVMGNIPGFTNAIFPSASMTNLNVVANLGLILFLFLVGLEVDLRYLISNWRIALSVGIAGMALPFGFGAAIAYGLYHQFRDEPGTVPIDFGVYLLFIGVAMAITAFPVLCRILTELKLLATPVGIIVLSAGVGNDVVGWVLLALCVALVNAGNGLTALWVLLTCVGYIIFLAYAIRPIFLWVLRRSGALENGPSQGIIALTLLFVLASAFFTQIIGVHAIFGAFIVGLLCPHEGGFAIKVTEKVEDLISAIFLPLYFALSGLNTDLGLLNSGMVWGYVIGVIAVAFTTKFIGAALAARLNGMVWREAFTIGSLMSCKGLVELIVLNIGLQAKILSTRTFTIFVVMALVTTFATTPLTSLFYPPWYQKKIEAWKRGEIDWDSGEPILHDDATSRDSIGYEKLETAKVHNVLVYLRLDTMPSIMAFVSVLCGKPAKTTTSNGRVHPSRKSEVQEENGESSEEAPKKPLQAHGVRLLELTDRESSVMQVSELDEYSVHDPIVNTFRTLGQFNTVAVSGEVSVAPSSSFADVISTKASEGSSDMILLPWSETGSMSDLNTVSKNSAKDRLIASSYNSFVLETLNHAPCTTAVLISSNFGGSARQERGRLRRTVSGVSLRSSLREVPAAPIADRSHHIFFPFFGGVDDRVALRVVLQLAESPDVTATIVHFAAATDYFASSLESAVVSPVSPTTPNAQDPTSNGKNTATATVQASATPTERDAVFFAALKNSLPVELAARIFMETTQTSNPVRDALERAKTEVGQSPRNAGDLVVVGRNEGARLAFAKESGLSTNEETSKSLGIVASSFLHSSLVSSTLVVQARGKNAE